MYSHIQPGSSSLCADASAVNDIVITLSPAGCGFYLCDSEGHLNESTRDNPSAIRPPYRARNVFFNSRRMFLENVLHARVV